jgi:RNA polymerase sigma factor (sigma-70 family)
MSNAVTICLFGMQSVGFFLQSLSFQSPRSSQSAKVYRAFMANPIVEELLAAYTELRRFLTRRLGNPDDAADVAQLSFERVYARSLTATITAPRAVLFRTAQRLCIDAARQRETAQGWEDTAGALLPKANAVSAERLASDRQLLAKIVQCLERMPARRREVFLLFRVDGYSRQHIAKRLGITEAAVAKHVVRATLDCARCFTALDDA